ncbi:hypothetical protein BCR36DRAFT_155528 [Piromyces finnis]|uniref:DUF5745 domain-containing protein n=1 Tax=Piromyces finnis TaxID=1754191 RepID=A0A1Y1UXB8_9FUNG|nr:hypothetical protein BCR36DRAFT_155528 [Piromyces finnis]|eukprot:ORX42748.1 hypothetical protein BCR36DRAFT_155528 [Piromyces finnis]
MIRNNGNPMMSSSSNYQEAINFEISDSEGIDIVNTILYEIHFPLRIKSLNECVSSLWIVLYEGLFHHRLEGIIRSKNSIYTEAKIMNIQTILDQLKNQFNIPFPSKMAYELYTGNKTYIMKFIYLFKILFDCSQHSHGKPYKNFDYHINSNNYDSSTSPNNRSIDSVSPIVQDELQKYLYVLFEGENETNPSQHLQSESKTSENNLTSISKKRNKKQSKQYQFSKNNTTYSSVIPKISLVSTTPSQSKSIKRVPNKVSNINDINESTPKETQELQDNIYDHVNGEDSHLNFLLNNDNYPLGKNEINIIPIKQQQQQQQQQQLVENEKEKDFDYHYHEQDETHSTTSTQKSFKSNRTRSGTNKYISLNDDIYRYIISNKIYEGGKLDEIPMDNLDHHYNNSNHQSKENIHDNTSSHHSTSQLKTKKNKKGKPATININAKIKRNFIKFIPGNDDSTSGWNKQIQHNHRMIQSLKDEFSYLQSKYQSLINDLHSFHTKNPNKAMEIHRMKAYQKNIKTYRMMVKQQEDPMAEQLRQCKFFHYIGEDHKVGWVNETTYLYELDERLQKKKAWLEKIMNSNPTLLNEMVIIILILFIVHIIK